MSSFDSCSESCGWAAAAIAALAYGSFGVPIKATEDIDVHPLVMQSYKTLMIFALGWCVTLLGVEVVFTKWGLLSGLLWVLGGTGGIYGIRMAGLAIAVGIWASIMILVNFFFGIIIFQEPVHDMFGTASSFLLLTVGLVGMSRYSAPQPTKQTRDSLSSKALELQREEQLEEQSWMAEASTIDPTAPHVVLFGGHLPLTRRQCGMAGAVANGIFTGCSLVPLHYAKEEGFGGERYLISIACGALFSNILIWIMYFMINCIKARSLQGAVKNMPKWHFKALWKPGFLAGILLAIAMFGSIFSVTYLGQGVGNSLVQTKILFSGLWGIFWFKEITGVTRVSKWFASALVTILAIVWLSLERLRSTDGGVEHYS